MLTKAPRKVKPEPAYVAAWVAMYSPVANTTKPTDTKTFFPILVVTRLHYVYPMSYKFDG